MMPLLLSRRRRAALPAHPHRAAGPELTPELVLEAVAAFAERHVDPLARASYLTPAVLTVEVLVPRPLDHFRADGYTLVPRALEYPIPADLAARWDDTPSTAVLLVRSSAPPVAVVQTLTSVRWSSNRAAQVSVALRPAGASA
ncbi:MAG: hypothetical protein PGN13_15970 [Patulibacter minatonensis]